LDDTECMELISRGGRSRERGIVDLFDRYATPIYRYFVRSGLSRADAEDLVQEVFVQVVRKIDSCRGSASVRGWIWAVARNRLISALRKNHPEFTGDDSDAEAGESQLDSISGMAADAIEECVKDGFHRFSKAHSERAQALALLSFQEMSISEVAQFLGRSVGATREYLSQCRKKLRPYLEPCFALLEAG